MRFRKIMNEKDQSMDIVDVSENRRVFSMQNQSILGMIATLGEKATQTTIGNIIQSIYPNLTKEELKELFD